MEIRVTHIGTATVLLEIGPLRLLTDPALDAAGRHYAFGFGTGSTKTAEPALPPSGLGRIDAVLLSHDQHADNLDDAGRALLPSVGAVVTTPSGARRLAPSLPRAVGLAPFASHTLDGDGGFSLRVTATPARHGPPLSRPIVGEVVGFVLEWPGQRAPVYLSGDTVLFDGVREVARRWRVGTALLHVGGVRFGITGPLRYTFDGREAAEAAKLLDAATVIPIHYEGWTHFRESRAATERALDDAGLAPRTRWLPLGEPVALDV